MIVKIRYKTDAKPKDTLHWRVLIDNVEHHASEVQIFCKSFTTKDLVEEEVEKWHITCEPRQVLWKGEKCELL